VAAGDSPGGFAVNGYRLQPRTLAHSLQSCDAIFRAVPFVDPAEPVLVGLPDTIWLPVDAFSRLPPDKLGFLTFPVARPELFDAVVSDDAGRVREIQVKREGAESNWIWGAFGMPGAVLHELANRLHWNLQIDEEAIHTDAPGSFLIVYLATNAEGLDKVQGAVAEALKSNPLGGSAFGSMTDLSAHRDELVRTTATYK